MTSVEYLKAYSPQNIFYGFDIDVEFTAADKTDFEFPHRSKEAIRVRKKDNIRKRDDMLKMKLDGIRLKASRWIGKDWVPCEQYAKLLDMHRELERDKRAADDRINGLLKNDEGQEIRKFLQRVNLFCVQGAIVEAPYPPVSPQIRDALSKEGYESVELYLGSQLVRPFDTVLDLGSGLGLSAIVAGMSAKEGKVVGFEADPRVAELAQLNANRNVSNVTIRNSAVSTESGSFDFYQSTDFLANSLFPVVGATKISVPCVAFSDVIAELRPAVITCDVEGAERNLFEAVDISCVRSIVLETHPAHIGEDGVEKCVADLAAAGLKKIDKLCWGPVFIFSRDNKDQYIKPFEIKPRRGTK